MTSANSERAAEALQTIAYFQHISGDCEGFEHDDVPYRAAATYLLTALRHLCDEREWVFDMLEQSALQAYIGDIEAAQEE